MTLSEESNDKGICPCQFKDLLRLLTDGEAIYQSTSPPCMRYAIGEVVVLGILCAIRGNFRTWKRRFVYLRNQGKLPLFSN